MIYTTFFYFVSWISDLMTTYCLLTTLEWEEIWSSLEHIKLNACISERYLRTSSYYIKLKKVVEKLDVITLVLQKFQNFEKLQWTVQSRLQRKALQSFSLKIPYVRASRQPSPNFGQWIILQDLISTLSDGD